MGNPIGRLRAWPHPLHVVASLGWGITLQFCDVKIPTSYIHVLFVPLDWSPGSLYTTKGDPFEGEPREKELRGQSSFHLSWNRRADTSTDCRSSEH
jgi:hypothetical protein